jgi:hypothetical protein
MSDNSRKTPLARSLEALAARKIRDAVQLFGQALPCTVVETDGAFATVKFEVDAAPFTIPNVTVPIAGSQYVRLPLQPGDGGFVVPADVRLAGISGTAPGTIPKLDKPANLTAIVFLPIGNKAWEPVDPDVLVLYGPEGVTIRKQDGTVKIELTNAGDVILTPAAGRKVIMNSDVEITGSVEVAGAADVEGEVTALAGTPDSVGLSTHTTSAVTVGAGVSGPPVSGT